MDDQRDFLQLRLPRELEADGTAGEICRVLSLRTMKCRPEGGLEVPVVVMNARLEKVLRDARLRGFLRYGYESIVEKLENERKGIGKMHPEGKIPATGRISRLILFSNDGSERFYRHVEGLLIENAPRLLGCLLDMDSGSLGKALTGKDRRVKIVMAEHKEVVASSLRAIAEEIAPKS